MSEKIKVGIIGAGRMAYWHLRGYKKNKDVEVIGIAGRTQSNIETLQRKFKIPYGYNDYREMLERNTLDAVNVTTPTYTHCPIVIKSLESGCHVLCEKPMAMTLEEADRMIKAERRAGKIFMIGFSQRFYKEFVHMKEIIDRGELGKIKIAWFRRGINMPPQKWYSEKEKSSGVTCELAIHGIDWLRWIIDSPVVQVSAELTEHDRFPGIDDNVWMILTFENGALGVVGASYTFPFLKRDIGVIGDKMALTIERSKVVVEKYGHHSLARLAMKFIQYGFIIPYWLYYNPFKRELEHFIMCIKTGVSPLVSSEDGREGLKIALKAVESAHTRQKIRL
ncbi:MAG: Gfo/Idh/MocA family oxidoreductase [Deltaproteobacteria bacterium]|nr:Gfo/Idh/MocA family oxidoreductase [Deltaproteobacteria bacterium]